MLALSAVAAVPVVEDGPVAPRISELEVTPVTGSWDTSYTIVLRITDPQGAEDIVALLYQIRERSELIQIKINDEGRGADRVAGDGLFTGESVVPDTAAIGVHHFQLFVRDRGGHQSNMLQYRFTVEPGPRLIPI